MGGILHPGQQQPPQLLLQLMIRKGEGPGFGHNDQVHGRQPGFMAAEEFSQQAFHPIASHRFTQTPGDHQSQPRGAGGRGSQDDPEMARMEPLTLGLSPKEIGATADPICLGETGGSLNGWVGDVCGAPAGGFRGAAQRGSPVLRP